MHLGTGNYHAKTARIYEDFGLFTADPVITDDVADLFNLLTGYGQPTGFHDVLVAPTHLRRGIIDEIEATAEAAAARRARADPAQVQPARRPGADPGALRGVAGGRRDRPQHPRHLRPAARACEGVSENIRVRLVVGRFLEHSRVYMFERGEEGSAYMGSADLMQRNLDNRVEVLSPVKDAALRAQMVDVVERCLADDTFAWDLEPDGHYERRRRGYPKRACRAHCCRRACRTSSDNDAVLLTAVVDLGSNSFRLVVFRYEAGGAWAVWDEIREPVRLSAGMGEEQVLRHGPVARALDTVRTFVAFCEQTGVDDVLAVGTSALRAPPTARRWSPAIAGRGPDGADPRRARGGLLRRAGHPQHDDGASDGFGLDMGGGSIQLMRLRDAEMADWVSLPLGAVRATEAFLADDDQKAASRRCARRCASRSGELDWLDAGAGPLAGIGGSVRNIAAAAQRLHGLPNGGVQGFSLTTRDGRRPSSSRAGRPQRRGAPARSPGSTPTAATSSSPRRSCSRRS